MRLDRIVMFQMTTMMALMVLTLCCWSIGLIHVTRRVGVVVERRWERVRVGQNCGIWLGMCPVRRAESLRACDGRQVWAYLPRQLTSTWAAKRESVGVSARPGTVK